jgi:hypothetical protein
MWQYEVEGSMSGFFWGQKAKSVSHIYVIEVGEGRREAGGGKPLTYNL